MAASRVFQPVAMPTATTTITAPSTTPTTLKWRSIVGDR